MLINLRKNIDKEELEQLPLFLFSGEVVVVEDAAQVDELAAYLSRQPYVGFDTETRPAFHKGEHYNVGLLQLATREKVYLFRLNKCGFRPALHRILSDNGVIKIGVGIRDDIRNLRKMADFTPASFIDLQDYAEQFGIQEKSFSKLMAIIFRVKISKRQRTSNWDAEKLTEAQIRYAATDAWGALEMYLQLSSGD